MHLIFYEWILKNIEYWNGKGIAVEEIINRIDNPEISGFPYVSVYHVCSDAIGEIDLHKVNTEYSLEFQAGRISNDKLCMYYHEFSEAPNFDLWQEKYVRFLCGK